MSPISTGLGEIYQYVIYADEKYKDKFSSTDLRSIQDWIVKRQLTGVKGVIEINSSGGHLKQDLVISNTNFRNWLSSESEVDVDLEKLPTPAEIENKDFVNHPMVQFQNQNSEVAKAQIEVQRAQLLPQLQTGL